MPQNITTSAKSLVEAAEREIENLSVEDAIKLHGRDDVVLVDIRDPRELQRDGKVPGAFHCPRGMLEFWIDPASPYHKAKFAEDKRFVFFCAGGLALGAGGAGGAAHGVEAGRPYPRRLRRLEERRWPGRGAGAAEAEGVMSNDEQPTPAASEAAPVPAAEPASAAPVAQPSQPYAGPERRKLWSTAEVWVLGAFSVIGLIGFIATFVLIVVRSPNAPVQRTLTAAEIQRLTGPAGERGPAGPAGPRGATGDAGCPRGPRRLRGGQLHRRMRR